MFDNYERIIFAGSDGTFSKEVLMKELSSEGDTVFELGNGVYLIFQFRTGIFKA